MLNPLNEQEIEFVKELLEERSMMWSSTWPLERRVIEVGTYWSIPKADEQHHIEERDVLDFIGGKRCVLYIPEDRVIGTKGYPLITLTRHQDEGGCGTNRIRCERIFVGTDPFFGSGRVTLKKNFPYFDFAKIELEDAGIWQCFKERGGWRKSGKGRYELEIYGDCDWNVGLVPRETIDPESIRGMFQWLSKEFGINLSLEDFAEESLRLSPQGSPLHQIEIERYKRPKCKDIPGGKAGVDAYLGIYGTAGLDRTYPGGAYFREGRLVFGQFGRDGNIRNPESFKQAVVDYFDLLSYELFEMFFYFKGLPQEYQEAVREII